MVHVRGLVAHSLLPQCVACSGTQVKYFVLAALIVLLQLSFCFDMITAAGLIVTLMCGAAH